MKIPNQKLIFQNFVSTHITNRQHYTATAVIRASNAHLYTRTSRRDGISTLRIALIFALRAADEHIGFEDIAALQWKVRLYFICTHIILHILGKRSVCLYVRQLQRDSILVIYKLDNYNKAYD